MQDHERIEELLAGYALLALSGQDAEEADRLLTDHVPGCPACRQTLSDFRILSGDLALAADPVPPPDLTLARIHRAIDEVPLTGRPARRGSFLALAAGVVALVAMGGLSFVMAGRASNAQDSTATALEALVALQSPGSASAQLEPKGGTPSSSGFLEISRPDAGVSYLVAWECPDPDPSYEYVLWLGKGGEFTPIARFSPSDGRVLLRLPVDVTAFDAIWITEEVAGVTPATPNTSRRSWSGLLG